MRNYESENVRQCLSLSASGPASGGNNNKSGPALPRARAGQALSARAASDRPVAGAGRGGARAAQAHVPNNPNYSYTLVH